MSGLVIKDLVVSVGAFRASLPELTVHPGELVCVMGKSGSGKSTLLNAVAGFLPDTSGKSSWNGTPLETLPPEKRHMAFVFQRPALFPHLTVLGNVEFGLRVQGVAADLRRTQAMGWLERLEVAELSARKSGEISEGQAQRVAIARALAPGFPVLLLDEPFSALDVSTRKQLREVLRRLVKDARVAAVMVTHHPEDARAIGDKIVVLEGGKVSWAGPVKEAPHQLFES